MVALASVLVAEVLSFCIAWRSSPASLLGGVVFVMGGSAPLVFPFHGVLSVLAWLWYGLVIGQRFLVSWYFVVLGIVRGWLASAWARVAWVVGIGVLLLMIAFTLIALALAGFCSTLGCGGLPIELVLVLAGICLSMALGVLLRDAPPMSLAVSGLGGVVLVSVWSWYALFDPEYLKLFGSAGTVLVVLGGSSLTASGSSLWPKWGGSPGVLAR